MKVEIKTWVRWTVLRAIVVVAITAWAITATVFAARMQPRTILIGLDESGTRLITSQDDPLLESERVKFVRDFLYLFYNYNSETYDRQISRAGSLMSDALWDSKKAEFHRIEKEMKSDRISQDARLLDLRAVSTSEYEADVGLVVRQRLVDHPAKYRVTLKLSSRKRSAENPYAWEIVGISETEMR